MENLKTSEVASMLGLTVDTLRRYARKDQGRWGAFKCPTCGNGWLFDKPAVELEIQRRIKQEVLTIGRRK